MSNLSSYNYYPSGFGLGIGSGFIIGVVLALIGTVFAAIFLIGAQKRSRYSGFMLRLFSHVNFENYIIPLILKFLYVFSALFAIVNGFITMVSGSFFGGLLMMILGPIGVRMAYELIMMLFSIHDGIMETNRLLRGGAQPRGTMPQQPQQPQQPYGRTQRYDGGPAQQPMYPDPRGGQEAAQPEQPRHYPTGYDPMRR